MLLCLEAEAAVTDRPDTVATAATAAAMRTRRPRRARMVFTFSSFCACRVRTGTDRLCSLHLPRSSARRAHDEFDGQRQRGGSRFGVLDLLQKCARCRTAEADLVLADRGQRRIEQRRELNVVEADDGELSGNTESGC